MVLPILLLQALFISMQAVQSLPTLQKATVAMKSISSNNPLAVNKAVRRGQADRKIPQNLDLKTLSLPDLVSMKPRFKDMKADKQLYRLYFANHPDVRKINLHDTAHDKVTQGLLQLSRVGIQDKMWKNKMTASIKDYLKDAPFQSEDHRKLIQNSIAGLKNKMYDPKKQQRQVQNLGREEIKRRRKLAESDFKQRTGYYYGQRSKVLQQKNPHLNQPLSTYIGEEANHLEAAEHTMMLGHFYSLTKKLEEYLKERKVPAKDLEAAIGLRSKLVKSISRSKKRSKNKNNDQLKVSTSSSSSLPSGMKEVSASESPQVLNPSIQSPQQQPPSEGIDMKWLEDMPLD
jgi:hypothetical protein